jgi:hypothetical protein
MTTQKSTARGILHVSGVALAHAGLTLGCYFSYMKTAFEIDHGGNPTQWTTIGQVLKAIPLYPILLPLLKLRPDLLSGWRAVPLLLANSFVWAGAIAVCRWLLSVIRGRP